MASGDFRIVKPVAISGAGSFTRAGPGTYIDKNGVLQIAGNDVLRLSYDLADLGAAPRPLVEPARTNIIRSSHNLADTNYWGHYASQLVANAAMAPNGQMQATKLVGHANDGYMHGDLWTAGSLGGRTFTTSVYLRADAPTTVIIYCYSNESDSFNNRFCEVTPEWRRFEITVTTILGDPGTYMRFQIGGGGLNTSSTPAVYLWGAQAEEASSASSLIQTGAAPVTRAADVIGETPGLAYSNVPETLPLWAAGTTYALGAEVRTASHLAFQSMVAENVGYDPEVPAVPPKWLKLGSTNRRRMFDKVVNSQTTSPEILAVVVKPGELVNAMGVLNVEGSRITVTQTESMYHASKSLVSHDVTSWYDFYYNEPIREGDVFFEGIPPYAASSLIITVENAGNLAAVGACLMGKAQFIGLTQWDLDGGILSYSGSETDGFGNTTFVKRENAKSLNFEVRIPAGYESEAYRILRRSTDTELLVIGTEDYSMTITYGYLGQWRVPVSNSGKNAHIEVKGLI